ncbi:probable E3 SUMO-protein ligase RNF212 [Ambystoma mexicanum]|uniref:probable E3 SUMO-protein ligase RNF212 n=1 Tax=Ambystoma mexicanum TaxID=8296 RepID=UPI0037E86E34
MDVDNSSQVRKPETVPGPNRLSLISPPHDGRMGSVAHRNVHTTGFTASQNLFSETIRLTPARIHQPTNGYSHLLSSGLQSSTNWLSDPNCVRASQMPPQTPLTSQSSSARHQISISSLLQRQRLGKYSYLYDDCRFKPLVIDFEIDL